MLDALEYQEVSTHIDEQTRARFWSRVRREPFGCWMWTGRVGPRGAVLDLPRCGTPVLAPQLSWEMAHGPLAKHTVVKHFCGQKTCVRPDHLYVASKEKPKPDLAGILFEVSPQKEQNYVRDDEQDNLLTAFSMRGYLVVLRFEAMTIPVSVTTDAAQTKSAAKMVALRRARRNDGDRYLGKLLSAKVVRDTDEARFEAGIDDSEYHTYVERQNKWFDMDLYRRMNA